VEGFEWLLELRDGMTVPAATMRRALRGITDETRATNAELRKLQSEQQRTGREATAMGRDMLGGLGLAVGLGEMVRLEKDAAEGMAELAAEGVKLSFEMNELREHSIRMFEGLSGSAAGGREMYDRIQELRTILPQSERELGQWSAKLMAAGMTDAGGVDRSLKAMSSASALLGGGQQGEAAAEKVSNLIAKSLEGGKFKGMAKTLVGTGVSADELAKELGMTPEAFQRAFKKGTIEANKGIEALTEVLQRKGTDAIAGTMGELPVIIAKGKEALAHMFDDVDVKPVTREIQVFFQAVGMAQPAGQSMKSTLTTTMDYVIKLVAQATHAITLGALEGELAILKLEHAFHPTIVSLKRFVDTGEALGFMKSMLYGAEASLFLMGTALKIALAPLLRIVQGFEMMSDAISFAVDKALDLKAAITGTPRPALDDNGGGGSDWGPANVGLASAPANARGGTVLAPAPGEVLASVAPGETILPKGQLSVGGSQATAAASSGDKTVAGVMGDVHLHIDGGGKGVVDAVHEATAMLVDMLEGAALEAGSYA
jgi:hypothetical protein